MKNTVRTSFLIVVAIISLSINAFSMPISGDCDISGTPGDYTFNFTVTNNIDSSYQQYVYFLGVDLPNDPLQGSPAGWWTWTLGDGVFNNYDDGINTGSNVNYTSVWATYSNSGALSSGSSLSGFIVHAASIPSEVHWFAFAIRDPYSDNQSDGYYESYAYFKGMNPGFEGVNDFEQTTVPEPATMSLLGLGFAGLFFRRKQKI